MGVVHHSGPLVVGPSGQGSVTAIGIGSDSPAPSTIYGGVALVDPRYQYHNGGGTEANALLSIGIGLSGHTLVVDQAPSTAVVNNIAVAVAVTTGTNIALVSSSGAGITVMTSALTIPQTGNVVPTAKLAIDGLPALVYFGTNKSVAVADPTKNIARGIAITASSGGVGGNFLVSGWDLYGFPQTEKITVASSPTGATTTNGKKAFKFINTITAQVTDTFSYSVGTSNVIGFPLAVTEFPLANVGWAGSPVTVSTGFVAAVSSTATNTTGDVRGTYTIQSNANGVLVLQMFQFITPANITTMSGYFGVTPA
jgi:hypothetical protein